MSRRDELRAKIEKEEREKLQGLAYEASRFADAFIERATKENPWQKTFIEDGSLHKALFGERRGGKSMTAGIAASATAMKTPNCKVLYIGLTQESVQHTMFDEVLPYLKRTYNLPAKLLGNNEMVFDNGSVIYLLGLDANQKQKDRVRGIKSSLNILDEMQSYKQDVMKIIQEVLGPTAADTKSPTILSGTAGNTIGNSYWYQITRHNTRENPVGQSLLHPEWKVYRCSWEENRAIEERTGKRVCDNVSAFIEEHEKLHPGWKTTDSFRQEYCAEWIVEKDSLIYKWTEANNLLSPLCVEIGSNEKIPMPNAHFLSSASYGIGIDLGYGDPTTMTVVCYNTKFSNKLYVIEVFQKSEMLINEVVAKLRSLENFYHPSFIVGDSSSLQVFETLKQAYGFPIQKADRQGKLSHQLLLNTDLQTRSIVFMPGCEELTHQLQNLTWDTEGLKKGRWVEDYRQRNDLADSFLYAHHFSRHMWYVEKKVEDFYLTHDEFNKQLADTLIRQNKRRKNDMYGGIYFAAPNIKGRWRN